MTAVAAALLYALFVWWFTTGLVMLLVLRERQWVAIVGAAVLFPVALYLLARSGTQTSIAGAYLAFSAAIVVWGTQEVAFLTGILTGPRPLPCPPAAEGKQRLRCALGAILYHELALLVSGAAVLAVTWGAPNQVGALTFLVLWIMRVSAKLNLFLGVPVLNDEFLPRRIVFLRSYFRRGPANALFPIAVGLSVLALGWLVVAAADPLVSTVDEIGYVLVAALLGLAIVEHAFMLFPLPIARLWAWSARNAAGADAGRPGTPDELERVAITSP